MNAKYVDCKLWLKCWIHFVLITENCTQNCPNNFYAKSNFEWKTINRPHNYHKSQHTEQITLDLPQWKIHNKIARKLHIINSYFGWFSKYKQELLFNQPYVGKHLTPKGGVILKGLEGFRGGTQRVALFKGGIRKFDQF